MKLFKSVLFTLPLMLLVSAPVQAKQAPMPESGEALHAEMTRLPWQEAGKHPLTLSSSSLQVPQGWGFLDRAAAQRYAYLLNGTEFPETEGIVESAETGEMLYFEYTDSGYVTLDDWSEMDPDALLADIIRATDAANKERKAAGMGAMRVVGWLQPPHLDRDTQSVYWAIEAFSEDAGPLVNYVALKLGRRGYETLTWVGSKEQFSGATPVMTAMLDAHTYDPGFRYAEYVQGDKVAMFGIAALVAASAGGTGFGKKGLGALLAALAVIVKKAGAAIVVALGAAGAAVKRVLTGKVGEEDATPPPPGGGPTANA